MADSVVVAPAAVVVAVEMEEAQEHVGAPWGAFAFELVVVVAGAVGLDHAVGCTPPYLLEPQLVSDQTEHVVVVAVAAVVGAVEGASWR